VLETLATRGLDNLEPVLRGTILLDRRSVIIGGLSVLASPASAAASRFDAVVSNDRSGPTDVPRFASLGQAIDAAPASASSYRIWLGKGRWQERATIRRRGVHIIGRGKALTRLQAATAAGNIADDGKPYGTFRTATLAIEAPDCRLTGLTIANTFNAPAEMRRPGGWLADEGGGQQAIALSLSPGADRTVVSDCAITSHQDTVYCATGRALFKCCLISGSYDFIFGGAAALFERCTILSRARITPAQGYIAAPSTLTNHLAGLVFDRCNLTCEPSVPDGSVFLGRPWRTSITIAGKRFGDPRSVGMAAYLRCRMDAHIAPSGWTRMWYTAADGNPRAWFEPEQARFSEYLNFGRGAAAPPNGMRRRGTMLAPSAAARLTREAMFGDWTPEPEC
jgi:pectinesterase